MQPAMWMDGLNIVVASRLKGATGLRERANRPDIQFAIPEAPYPSHHAHLTASLQRRKSVVTPAASRSRRRQHFKEGGTAVATGQWSLVRLVSVLGRVQLVSAIRRSSATKHSCSDDTGLIGSPRFQPRPSIRIDPATNSITDRPIICVTLELSIRVGGGPLFLSA